MEAILGAYADRLCRSVGGPPSADARTTEHVAQEPMSKPADDPKSLERLKATLEALHPDVDVIEGIRDGKIYALKLQTPITTYLDEATWNDWVRLVKRDIAAAGNWRCPFCATQRTWTAQPSFGRCDGCGARVDHASKLLAEIERLDAETAWGALIEYKAVFAEDKAHNCWWWRPPTPDAELDALLARIEGPDRRVGEAIVPVVVYEDEPEGERVLPTCALCRHAIRLDEPYPGGEAASCVYPLDGPALTARLEDAGITGYQDDRRGEDKQAQVWNRLMDRAMIAFPPDAREPEPIEGMRPPGPLCARFSPDADRLSLDGWAIRGQAAVRWRQPSDP